MILIDDIIVSDEILEKKFICNLKACKGACCVEGDGGAPLEEEEADLLLEHIEKIAPYISPDGKKAINTQGVAVPDNDGQYTDLATPLIDDGACAYIGYDNDEIAYCSIERAYNDGVIPFNKPISCHLYPIRMKRMDGTIALNYDTWDICTAACTLGEQQQMPVHEFLKVPIIRRFGSEFYEVLDQIYLHEHQ